MKEWYLKRQHTKAINGRKQQLSWMLRKQKELPQKIAEEIKKLLVGTEKLLNNPETTASNLKALQEKLDGAVTKTYREWKQNIVWQTFDELWLVIVLALIVKFFFLGSFRVPSGSMMDTILIGDNLFVLMNRYGLTIPFRDRQFVSWGTPDRGDIITFTEPTKDRKALVKRVIGLPGDKVFVSGTTLRINGKEATRVKKGEVSYTDSQGNAVETVQYREKNIDGKEYNVLFKKGVTDNNRLLFEQKYCRYCGIEFTVPEGHFFAMGDNRDNSYDSRFWGFIPRNFLQGTPLFVWFSIQFGDSIIDVEDFRPLRIGHIIK
ncbi:signal peptidase I [bacterium]|nr:signal peptidase I [bacterium]